MQDTLQNRIYEKKELSGVEIDEIMSVIGARCSEKTKRQLRRKLNAVPDISNYGIYGRVHLNAKYGDTNIIASYCAGQSYPDEIRTVRSLLKK